MRIKTKHAKNLKLSTRYTTLLKQRKHAKHAKSVNMQKIQKKDRRSKIQRSEKVYKKIR